MDIADPAAAYAALRASTAEMFDYDLASASLTQGLQIDLVSLLRLEVDTMQGRVLAGETVDLQRLVAAHGLLSRMLPAQALVAPAAAADQGDPFAGAREELAALLDKRFAAIAARRAYLLRDVLEREEMAACMAAAPSAPVLVAPSPPEPVQRTDNVVSIGTTNPELQRLASRTPTPQSAEDRAKGERTWRDFYDGGAVVAPAWSPPNDRR
jgi:hypothetical protein